MHDGADSKQVVGIVFPQVDIAPGAVRAPCPRNLAAAARRTTHLRISK
jgi:hypothetical protein